MSGRWNRRSSSGSWRRFAAPIVLAILTVASASRLAAQEHLNVARGFARHGQQALGIDAISTYNGNLTLTIALGPSYVVGPELSFQLFLLYNSQVWELQNVGAITVSYPSRTDNAGVGWRVSIGQLVAPNSSPDVDSGQWVYISADGSRHHFYPSLHDGEPTDPNFFYTRDGSYLRLNAAQRKVAFANGIEHIFFSDGLLQRIEDPHGHWVAVAYTRDGNGDVTDWTISDSRNRVHYVHFQDSGSTLPRKVVREVELEAVATPTRSKYTFRYQNESQTPCNASSPLWLPFLIGLDQPDGTSYSMGIGDYYIEPPPPMPAVNACRSGRLARINLATGGRIEWDYRVYKFPDNSTSRLPWQRNSGVSRRTLLPASSTTSKGTWLYATTLDSANNEVVNTLTEPSGTLVKSYFGVAPEISPPDERAYEYGLPFTRRVGDGTGRYLSKEIVAASGTRTSYVRYEHDAGPVNANDPEEAQRLNQRQAGSRIAYEDGTLQGDSLTNFDGHGHYRSHVYDGTFPGNNSRVEAIGWTAGGGYSPGHPSYQPMPTGARWVLGNYAFTWSKEGTAPLRFRSYCFDANGYLLGRRIHGSNNDSADYTTSDLVEVYVPSSANGAQGFVGDTYFLGGDTQPIPADPFTGFVCSLAQSSSFYGTAPYRIHHSYSSGVLSSLAYYNAAGSSVLEILDRTIDYRTGLPTQTADPSDVTTSYLYDDAWRPTTITPSGEAPAVFNYTNTSVTFDRLQGGSSLLQLVSTVDAWGRAASEKQRTGAGAGSFSETVIGYDDQARQNYVSVPGTPGSGTTIRTFDGFGRPTLVRPPDGSGHDVTIGYTGVKSTARTVKVFQPTSCPTPPCGTETSATTTETFDRFGRLYEVQEPNRVRTRYEYDVDSNLTRVCQNVNAQGACGQERLFNYDTRGLLLFEQHPEAATTTYSGYDARGHATRRIDGISDLAFAYDRAERLTTVTERLPPPAPGQPQPTRTLKTLTYAGSNGNYTDPLTGQICFQYSKGKVAQQSRFNYVQVNGGDITVEIREGATYCGLGGRVSRRQLENFVNAGPNPFESFVWPAFGYDAIGQPTSVVYPNCTYSQCTTPTPRTVTSTYDYGLLRSVGIPGSPGYYASSITYHPSVMVNQVVHNNLPGDPTKSLTDTYAADPNGMPRTGAIAVTTPSATPRWSTGSYAYDGAGNVRGIGTHSFVYDALSRVVQSKIYLEPTTSTTARTQDYSYDLYGNINAISGSSGRTTTTSAATNRLTIAGASYDLAGNLTAYNGNTAAYGPFNQMWRYRNASSEEWIHLYTADDERVWTYKTNNTSLWTLRGLDGKVLREYTSGGTWSVAADYIYRDGLLLAVDTPQGRRNLHLDHLGTPRLTSDSLAAQSAYHVYYPYGEEATAFNQDAIRAKFTGHERDLGSLSGAGDDIDYMHARHFNALLGRFQSTDLIHGRLRLPQTWNRYSYVIGNPLKFIDPTGLDFVCTDPQDAGTCAYSDSIGNAGPGEVPTGLFGNVADSPLRDALGSLTARLEQLTPADLEAFEDNDTVLPSPEGCSVFDSTGKCLAKCAGDQLGVRTLFGAGAVGAGLPVIPKPFVTPGSSPGTSVASLGLSRLFPQRIPVRVWAPTLANPAASSKIVGRIAGRWVPWIGWALLAKDAAGIANCVAE